MENVISWEILKLRTYVYPKTQLSKVKCNSKKLENLSSIKIFNKIPEPRIHMYFKTYTIYLKINKTTQ